METAADMGNIRAGTVWNLEREEIVFSLQEDLAVLQAFACGLSERTFGETAWAEI